MAIVLGMRERELTDKSIADLDEDRLAANIEACDKHLADLVRVYGQPPDRVQPVSYPRFRPHQVRRVSESRMPCDSVPPPVVRPSSLRPRRLDHLFRTRQQFPESGMVIRAIWYLPRIGGNELAAATVAMIAGAADHARADPYEASQPLDTTFPKYDPADCLPEQMCYPGVEKFVHESLAALWDNCPAAIIAATSG